MAGWFQNVPTAYGAIPSSLILSFTSVKQHQNKQSNYEINIYIR